MCLFLLNVVKFAIAGIEQFMTPQEKDKLYAAIGYSETAVDPTLPKTVGMIWVG